MRTSPNTIPGLILMVTVGVLSAAYSAQYVGGLRPCILCLYSRIPWFIAGGLMLVTILLHFSGPGRRGLLLLAGLALLAGAGISAYHVGVEQGYFQPPDACSAAEMPASLDELKALLQTAAPPRCDEIPWQMYGVSLAGYNVIASFAMAVAAFIGIRRA